MLYVGGITESENFKQQRCNIIGTGLLKNDSGSTGKDVLYKGRVFCGQTRQKSTARVQLMETKVEGGGHDNKTGFNGETRYMVLRVLGLP